MASRARSESLNLRRPDAYWEKALNDDELRVEASRLNEELARREKERADREAMEFRAMLQTQKDILEQNPAFLQAFLPPHGRTSCSDENMCNGWGSAEDGGYRCERDAIIQTVRDGGAECHLVLRIERVLG